jgi:hypothetical protein
MRPPSIDGGNGHIEVFGGNRYPRFNEAAVDRRRKH